MNIDFINNKLEHYFEAIEPTLHNRLPFPHNTDRAEFFADLLKCRATYSEMSLSFRLRKLPFKFQEPIMCYVADFMNPDFRLIIEVDGEYHHDFEKWAKRDLEREQYLQNYGFNIVRFTNEEVEKYPREVVAVIDAILWFVRTYKSCLPPIPHQKSWFLPKEASSYASL